MMKRTLLFLFLTFVPLFALEAKDYEVRGPQGGISFKICLPEGFSPQTDKCPMVILMHGIFSSERYKETYGDKADFKTIDGENHTITRHREVVVREVVDYFKGL